MSASRLLDVTALRADTPGVEHSVHLNAAGASLMPRAVVGAVREHLELETRLGGYEAAERRRDAADDLYAACAELIGCGADEIAFVENATRGWDMAFYAFPFSPGDRILTSVAEYASNYIAYMQVARRTGAVVEAVPNDEHGQLSVSALAAMLDERVKLVALTHVPTNGGLVNPAAAIGAVTRRAGVPFLLDACQSAGQLPLDVRELRCDALSFTGRKYVRGPRGTGVLYVRRELAERLEPPLLDLHAATWTGRDSYRLRSGARRFENWESNVAGKIGLATAVRYVLDVGIEEIRARVGSLADRLRNDLASLPGIVVHDQGVERCGIVTFTVADREPKQLRDELLGLGFSVWHSDTASTRLDMEARGLKSVVRASVHYYNTVDELDRFLLALSELR